MEPSKAIDGLKNLRLFMELEDKQNEIKFAKDNYEAITLAIKALEKQIPKKPIKSEKQVIRYVNTYCCPICNLKFTGTGIAKWCYHCGQKLDWSEESEENNGID